MMKQYQYSCVLCVLLAAGCGGGGSSGTTSLDDGLGEVCNNTFHQTLIGLYTGTIDYPSQPGGVASIGSCRWTVSMEITGRSVGSLCFLNANIEAPVIQSIVLSSDDPNRFQCFSDNSYRSINDNVPGIPTVADLNAIPFPHPIQIDPRAGLPTQGPYFGDSSVNAIYLNLFDIGRRLVNSLTADGEGRLFVEGDVVSGTLVKE